MIMDYNVEGLITLRNAIVEQAVKDYARVKRYLLTHPNRPCVLQKAELEQIQRYFLSDSFVECDGEYIIKKLDRMIE